MKLRGIPSWLLSAGFDELPAETVWAAIAHALRRGVVPFGSVLVEWDERDEFNHGGWVNVSIWLDLLGGMTWVPAAWVNNVEAELESLPSWLAHEVVWVRRTDGEVAAGRRRALGHRWQPADIEAKCVLCRAHLPFGQVCLTCREVLRPFEACGNADAYFAAVWAWDRHHKVERVELAFHRDGMGIERILALDAGRVWGAVAYNPSAKPYPHALGEAILQARRFAKEVRIVGPLG